MTAGVRGGAVGALTGAIAVAAHALGGGGAPSSATWTFLIALCCSLGVAAGSVRVRGALPIALWLAVGQAGGHWALSLGLGSDMAPMHHPLTPTMLAAHAAAIAVCAALVSAAEKLYGPITSVLRAPFAEPFTLPLAPRSIAVDRDVEPAALPVVATSTISRRGPPVLSY